MKIDFSHIVTFISLIFGFSLMHAITVLTTYIQNSNKIKFNLIWIIWAINTIVVLVATWWRIFRRWSTIEIWYPYYFFYLVLLSFLLAIIFFIRFDKFDELDKGNLEKQFFESKKPFFIGFSTIYIFIALGQEIVFGTINLEVIKDKTPLLIQGFLMFCLAFINHKIVHLFLATTFLIGALIGMFYGGQ